MFFSGSMIEIAHNLGYNCSLHLREVILSSIYSQTVEGHWGYEKKKSTKEKEKMLAKNLEEFTQDISNWNPENPDQLLLPWKNRIPAAQGHMGPRPHCAVALTHTAQGSILQNGQAVSAVLFTWLLCLWGTGFVHVCSDDQNTMKHVSQLARVDCSSSHGLAWKRSVLFNY